MVERLLDFHEFLGYIFSPTRRKEESPSLGMLHCLPPSLHSSFPSFFLFSPYAIMKTDVKEIGLKLCICFYSLHSIL